MTDVSRNTDSGISQVYTMIACSFLDSLRHHTNYYHWYTLFLGGSMMGNHHGSSWLAFIIFCLGQQFDMLIGSPLWIQCNHDDLRGRR